MALSDSKAQSLANLQPPPVAAPPSYLTSLALTPEETFGHALEDLSRHDPASESQFYVPTERRQNPKARILHQQLADTWEKLPLYDPRTINSTVDKSTVEGVIEAFFLAISQGDDSLVQKFLDNNLLDANTPRSGAENGLTPLLCAVQHQQLSTVRLLIANDAKVDGFGVCRPMSNENQQMRTPKEAKLWRSEAAVRTPLHLAAQMGNLDLVKILLEEYRADDSVVAPDGQLALRLAKGNGHKAVVSYLPARRGGGYRRWKTKHHKFMKRMHKSVDVLGEVGLMVFWKIPKSIITGLASCMKEVTVEIWKNKHKFAGWCWELAKDIWRAILKLPQTTRDLAIECWKAAVHIVTKTIPKAAVLLYKFSKNLLKEVSDALIWIANRTASFLHTLFHALLSAFRALTWANVRNGFLDLVRALFISFPKAFLRALQKTIPATWKGLVGLVKCLWYIIWFLCLLILKSVEFVMVHIWRIISAVGGTTATAGKEAYVWINPKG